MTAIASTLPFVFGPTPLSRAISEPAVEVHREVSEALDFGSAEVLTDARSGVLFSVLDALNGGVDVAVETLALAIEFASLLPLDAPPFDVVVERDGGIAFDWDLGPRAVLSVVVRPSGHLGFASSIGTERLHGSVAFAGAVDDAVSRLVGRITAAAARMDVSDQNR